MSNEFLKVGDTVVLCENTSWSIGEGNPLGVFGKVVEVDTQNYFGIEVEWSDGSWNLYHKQDNDLIKVDPNDYATPFNNNRISNINVWFV